MEEFFYRVVKGTTGAVLVAGSTTFLTTCPPLSVLMLSQGGKLIVEAVTQNKQLADRIGAAIVGNEARKIANENYLKQFEVSDEDIKQMKERDKKQRAFLDAVKKMEQEKQSSLKSLQSNNTSSTTLNSNNADPTSSPKTQHQGANKSNRQKPKKDTAAILDALNSNNSASNKKQNLPEKNTPKTPKNQTPNPQNTEKQDGTRTTNNVNKELMSEMLHYAGDNKLSKEAIKHVLTVKNPTDPVTLNTLKQLNEMVEKNDTSEKTMRSGLENCINALSVKRLQQKKGREQFLALIEDAGSNLREGETLKFSHINKDHHDQIVTHFISKKDGEIIDKTDYNCQYNNNLPKEHLDPYETKNYNDTLNASKKSKSFKSKELSDYLDKLDRLLKDTRKDLERLEKDKVPPPLSDEEFERFLNSHRK